ncbi:MAG: hypothetical protein IKZ02_06325 [Alphaproteobacteria bacterium]|nr:hypothetical protein [Alphaproteobacteria bacterium]
MEMIVFAGLPGSGKSTYYISEFMANDSSHKSKSGNNVIKRTAFIPTPGCRQYDSYPVVMNKEDFT